MHRMEPRSDHHAYLTDHHQLFGPTNEQYVILTHQRPLFVARAPGGEPIDDIQLIDEGDTHLLGSIGVWPGTTRQDRNRLELVGRPATADDGDDHPGVHPAAHELDGEADEAAEVARLLSAKPFGGKAPGKVALDPIDRRSSIGWCRTTGSSHSRTSNWRARSKSFGVGSPSEVRGTGGVSLSPENRPS